MNGIYQISGFNRMEPLLIPREFQRMSSVISKNGDIPWPPRSPDLSPCDFFLWGYLKSKVYIDKQRIIPELKEAIRLKIAAIPGTMLENVMKNFNDRLQECIDVEGRHLPRIVFHN